MRRIASLWIALVASACFRPDAAPYTARMAALAGEPLYFYPTTTSGPTKAFVFFVGNDVGFWGAHQQLAKRLAGNGYDVVGFDVKHYYARLPPATDTAARAAAFADSVRALIARSRAELHADSLPVVVAGHSIGAEVASWIALHAPPPQLTGLLMISPGGRGHLRISLTDLAMGDDPTEPGSFSIASNIAGLPPAIRVALIRGTDDRLRRVDPELLKAGGKRMDRWAVPWGGHSMRNILLSGPFVERALGWTLAPR